MSISSIGNNRSLYNDLYKYLNVSNNTAITNNMSSSQSQNSGSIQGISSNDDGDIFELTGDYQNVTAGQYAPPPPPPPPPSESSSSNSSTTSTASSVTEIFSKLDTDSDGSVSETEFMAARPSDVSESMAANLYKSFDTDSSGSLTESEYTTAMNNAPSSRMAPPPPPPPPPSESDSSNSNSSSTSTASSLVEMFSKLDTDSDGSVSEEEFMAARPSDVSESMAANLYKSFDTDSSGSLTESEYTKAMNNAPSSRMAPPPQSGSSTNGLDIKSLLDKIANGTVTDADLQNMQSLLQQGQK